MNVEEIIDEILDREGGFVHRAEDRGGPTNFGITQATLSEWHGRPATAKDVADMSKLVAREIYREEYIIKPGFLGIESPAVCALAVDCAVNHGPKKAVKMLQEAAHVFPDGVFGPKTKDAVNRMTAAVLYRRLIAARVIFYGEIIAKDPELARARVAGYDLQAVFAAGWLKRAARFIEESA